MSATFFKAQFKSVVGVAGLALLIGALPATAAESIGTQPEEYGSPPAPKMAPRDSQKTKGVPPTDRPAGKNRTTTKPNNTTSTGREKTGPGAQPEEYNAGGGGPKVGPYDTVHNVRIRKDTPNPDSVSPKR